MKANALYFPYIRVPQSVWFTRVLLYWDRVGAIIPSEYIHKPESLGQHTRGLIERGLVHQVFPGGYLGCIPEFVPSFQAYLEGLEADLDKRRQSFRDDHAVRVHMEKMGPIENLLHEFGLAKVKGYPWFDVETDTARDFMAYLAGCLGQLEEIQSMPVTDSQRNLDVFVGRRGSGDISEQKEDALRMEILERVFPAPRRPLTPEQIEDFKAKHGDTLRSFRRALEREVLSLAELQDKDHRTKRMRLFEDEIQEQVEAIERALQEHGYGGTVLGKFCPVISAFPGAHWTVGLISAIYGAFRASDRPNTASPVAYAAYAQVELLS